jgi:hypothetical protein
MQLKIKKKVILLGLSTGVYAMSSKNLLKEWNIEGLADCIVGMDSNYCKEMILNL